MTNPYFKRNYFPEQNLLNDLVVESIDINGIVVFFIPREYVNKDSIFTEDVLRRFENAYEIPVYLEESMMEGQDLMLAKFGIQFEKTATFTVARETFKANVPSNPSKSSHKPNVGDLIYVPLGEGFLFEIRHVINDEPFFTFGALYTWKLRCEAFTYSSEEIDTDIPEVDEIEDYFSYKVDLVLNTGSGNFYEGESVSFSSSNVGAQVVWWNVSSKLLTINNLTGNVNTSLTVIGEDSGASWTIASKDEDAYLDEQGGQNTSIDSLGETIGDWSEGNPFGDF